MSKALSSPPTTNRFIINPVIISIIRLNITIPIDTNIAALPKKAAAIRVMTAILPVQGTNGATMIVNRRDLGESMMRVPRIAGTLQPNPSTSGKTDLPCRPSACINRSVTKAARAV